MVSSRAGGTILRTGIVRRKWRDLRVLQVRLRQPTLPTPAQQRQAARDGTPGDEPAAPGQLLQRHFEDAHASQT